MAALLSAKQISGTADVHITHGDLKATAEIGKLFNRL